MAKAKKITSSKTFWVGVLTIITGILTTVAGELSTGAGLTFIGVVNIVLRFVTKQSVTLN
jgi:uncharacterized membrane protein